MKKIQPIIKSIVTLILTCTLALPISAQQNKLTIGLEGGPALIDLRGGDLGNIADPTIGFSGGLTCQYNFQKVLSLRTGFSYERKGAVISGIPFKDANGQAGTLSLHLNFDYFTVPVLLRANFGKKVNFFLNAGPFFGYLIKQQDSPTSISGSAKYYPRNNTSGYHHFDAGIASGLGFSVPVNSKLVFSLEIRNNTGLYKIGKPVNNQIPLIKTTSTNLLIGIAYKFGSYHTEPK
ncbi:MAG: porin family protein [Bacteroidia bacterium]